MRWGYQWAGPRRLLGRAGAIEPRYFTQLPGDAPKSGGAEFDLPSSTARGRREEQLLWTLFDLVRHGQAHQSQQVMVRTTDDLTFGVSISGVTHGRTLATAFAQGRPPNHLAVLSDQQGGDVFIILQPEVLFLDLEQAMATARVFARGLPFGYLERPHKPGLYAYTASAAEQALRTSGHPPFSPPAPPQSPPPTVQLQSHGLRRRIGQRLIKLGERLRG